MPIARFQMPDGRIARFEVPEGTTPEQAQVMMEAAMTTYRVKAPNGATYRVEGPEGASNELLAQVVLEQHPESGNPPEKPAEEVGLLGPAAQDARQYTTSENISTPVGINPPTISTLTPAGIVIIIAATACLIFGLKFILSFIKNTSVNKIDLCILLLVVVIIGGAFVESGNINNLPTYINSVIANSKLMAEHFGSEEECKKFVEKNSGNVEKMFAGMVACKAIHHGIRAETFDIDKKFGDCIISNYKKIRNDSSGTDVATTCAESSGNPQLGILLSRKFSASVRMEQALEEHRKDLKRDNERNIIMHESPRSLTCVKVGFSIECS